MHALYTVSRLLDYPDASLWDDQKDLRALVQESALPASARERLLAFMDRRLADPAALMQWQSDYDGLFERGRSVSLWLFEHVHGESRDRGQAMVDLMAEYRRAGLEIDQKELPDFLPLFLEFLATQGDENAQSWLLEVEAILATLLCRLEQRHSDYADLLYVLLEAAGSRLSLDPIRESLRNEQRDDTREAMDKVWEEEMVTFGVGDAQDSCASAPGRRSPAGAAGQDYVPVQWVDFNRQRPEQVN